MLKGVCGLALMMAWNAITHAPCVDTAEPSYHLTCTWREVLLGCYYCEKRTILPFQRFIIVSMAIELFFRQRVRASSVHR